MSAALNTIFHITPLVASIGASDPELPPRPHPAADSSSGILKEHLSQTPSTQLILLNAHLPHRPAAAFSLGAFSFLSFPFLSCPPIPSSSENKCRGEATGSIGSDRWVLARRTSSDRPQTAAVEELFVMATREACVRKPVCEFQKRGKNSLN